VFVFKRLSSIHWWLITCTSIFIVAYSTSIARSSPSFVKIEGWTPTTALSQALASRNAVVRGNYLYVVGGKNASDTPVGVVYVAAIQGDGSLSTWGVAASLPTPVYLHAIAATETHLYVVGGWDGGKTRAEIWRAAFLDGGQLSAFQVIAQYPITLDLHEALIVQNRLYVIGGWTGQAALNNVRYADITADGLGGWVNAPPLPRALFRLSATAYQNRIYVTGGFDGSVAQANVYVSTVQPDGSLTPWQVVAILPISTYYHETVVHDNRLLILGGRGDAGELRSAYSAGMNVDGTLTGWTTEVELPESLYRFAAVAVNRNGSDFVYVLGGLHGADYRASVYLSTFPQVATPTPTRTPSPTPTFTPTPTPILGINLSMQNSPRHWVGPGEEIAYVIYYQNSGIQKLDNVTIVNSVPPHVELVAGSVESSAGGSVEIAGGKPGDVITWSVGSLAAQATGSVRYRVVRPTPQPLTVPRALAIHKVGPPTASAGEPITYTLMVTNNTAFSITNLVLVDVLPEGATYMRGSNNPTVQDTVQWNIAILPGDATLVREFSVTAEHTVVNSNYYVSSDEGPTAKGREVVVTVVNGTDPPSSGDGIMVINPGATVMWEVNGQSNSNESNRVYNPGFLVFLPVLGR
jgi:uncharacterized repeat protein (TIGR01451 family)